MAKNKQIIKLQKRDWAILVLLLMVIGTNWLWFQSSRDLSKRLDYVNLNDYKQFVQISKLKLCIDENTHPCDVTPQ